MMIRSKTYLALLAAGLIFFGAAACSDDAEDDNGKVEQDEDATGAGDDAADDDGEGNADLGPLPDGFSFEAEYDLRFTKFALDEDAPLNALNNLLDKNIKDQDDHYPIVVLLSLRDISDDGTMELRGGAGLKSDIECLPSLDDVCDYVWDEDGDSVPNPAEFDTETGQMKAGLPALDFAVTFETGGNTLKSAIPISDLTLTGALRPTEDADGVEITNGVLVGYITKSQAETAEIQLSPGAPPLLLSDLLSNTPLTDDLSGDGNKDAWLLTGTFEAEETLIAD